MFAFKFYSVKRSQRSIKKKNCKFLKLIISPYINHDRLGVKCIYLFP